MGRVGVGKREHVLFYAACVKERSPLTESGARKRKSDYEQQSTKLFDIFKQSNHSTRHNSHNIRLLQKP